MRTVHRVIFQCAPWTRLCVIRLYQLIQPMTLNAVYTACDQLSQCRARLQIPVFTWRDQLDAARLGAAQIFPRLGFVRKMTPLPRWVLLALLLAVVAAHPVDHACVRLCRARNTSPETTGVCEHQLRLVLQSSGGRLPIRRLFRLCFTPYHGAGPSGCPFFDDTGVCRVFGQSLILRHGCTCVDDDRTRVLEEDRRRVQELEGDRSKKVEAFGMLKTTNEHRPMVSADDRDQRGPEIEALLEAIAKIGEADEDSSSRAESKNEGNEISAPASHVDEHNDADVASIDWDLWCLARCDNGQGVSACDCDIVP